MTTRPMTTRAITLQSGRTVALHELASGDGDRTVVLCHPAPGSGGFDPDPEQTAARGVRLLALDRPGYGGSEPVGPGEWASVDRAADDVVDMLGQVGAARVGVAGWSAGGRVALALAARHPDLVDRVAVLATPAPDEKVPWIPPEQKAGLEALAALPPEQVHATLSAQLGGMLEQLPSPMALLGPTDADADALDRPGARARLEAMIDGALVQGPVGIAADIAGYCLRRWGFELSDVAAKTLLLYGSADPVAGPAHGRWYRGQLADARYEQVPGQGHLLVIPMWKRVLAHLAPGTTRR